MKNFNLELKLQQHIYAHTNNELINMKLYLMRHGEALSSDIDPEQGLSDNGKEKIEALAKNLRQQHVSFKSAFHSEKKRAMQTAEIMTRVLSSEVIPRVMQDIKPNDDPRMVAPEMNTWKEDTLVTTHLPFLPNLVTLLTGQDVFLSAVTFETGTVICLEKGNNDSWSLKWSSAPSEI